MKFVLVAVMLLTACNSDVEYKVDGVKVLLNNGNGPTEHDMLLAVELYRREAEPYWDLTYREETEIWRSIEQIKWTGGAVTGDGTYDHDTRKILLRWRHGCAATSKLYWMLTRHYSDNAPTQEDDAWTHDIVVGNSFLCN